MRNRTPLLATIVACVFGLMLAGCKTDAESQVTEVVDKQNEMVKILKGVTDEASAKAAGAKIKALGKEVEALEKKHKDAKVSAEDLKKAEEKYKTERDKAMKEIEAEMDRLAKNPALAMHVATAMMEAAPMKAGGGSFGK